MGKGYRLYNGGAIVVAVIIIIIVVIVNLISKNSAENKLDKVMKICRESGWSSQKCESAQKANGVTCNGFQCTKEYTTIVPKGMK